MTDRVVISKQVSLALNGAVQDLPVGKVLTKEDLSEGLMKWLLDNHYAQVAGSPKREEKPVTVTINGKESEVENLDKEVVATVVPEKDIKDMTLEELEAKDPTSLTRKEKSQLAKLRKAAQIKPLDLAKTQTTPISSVLNKFTKKK